MNTFGERFKNERKKKGLTQEALAEKFLLQKSSISRYESDKQIPEIDLLRKIAQFFDVSIDYLLSGNNSVCSNNEEMVELYNNYSKLTDNKKKIIDMMIEELLEKEK